MQLVERTFHLKEGAVDHFIQKLHEIYPDLENDEDLQTFAVIQRQSNLDDVIIRLILADSSSWEHRLQKPYVQQFLADTSDQVKSIDTDFQEVVKFYSSH